MHFGLFMQRQSHQRIWEAHCSWVYTDVSWGSAQVAVLEAGLGGAGPQGWVQILLPELLSVRPPRDSVRWSASISNSMEKPQKPWHWSNESQCANSRLALCPEFTDGRTVSRSWLTLSLCVQLRWLIFPLPGVSVAPLCVCSCVLIIFLTSFLQLRYAFLNFE